MKSLKSIFLRPGASFPSLLGILLLIAACNNTSECKNDGLSYRTCSNRLVCQNSPQQIAADGTATLTFYAYWDWEAVSEGEIGNGPDRGLPVTFTCSNGTCTASAETEFDGTVICTFKTDDPQNFKGATVTAKAQHFIRSTDGRYDEGGVTLVAVGVIQGLNGETPDPGEQNIMKAYALNDNTVVVQKKGGEPETFSYRQDLSQWSKDKDGNIHVYMDQSEDSAQGMAWAAFPTSTIGTNTVITKDFLRNNPLSKMGFERYVAGINGSAHGGTDDTGNIKTDGSSSFWIVEGTPTKGDWHGTYVFMFYIVIQDGTFNNETHQWEYNGDEYIVYGKGIIEEYIPHVTSFELKTESDFIKPGGSVKVLKEWHYDEEAVWDWNDVQLVASATEYDAARNGQDEGYLSWDASKQTLTGLKAYHNTYPLYVKFALKSNPSVSRIMSTLCVGEGWPYTSFTVSPDFQQVSKDNSGADFRVTWEPSSVTTWDPAAIEIDPSSNQNNNFYYIGNKNYGTYGSLYLWNSTPVLGTETLTFRLKSDHSVTSSMQFRVVNRVLYSFAITYLHNNSYIVSENGAPNGICNYPMGLSLGVITDPVDADWNWFDVELIPGYDNTFSFSGLGGRDDHPKLMLKTSHDGTNPGVQVGFRLKYDHSKTSYIYVTHN